MTTEKRLGRLQKALRHGIAKIRRIVTFNGRRRKAIKRLKAELGPRFGVDLSWGNPSIGALRDSGVTFVARYLSRDASKNLTSAEVKTYHRAGIDVVCVWEGTASEAANGRAVGKAAAELALAEARACGKPEHRPIYFAVDFEASLAQVRAFFEGVNEVLGVALTGAYGGYQVMHELFDAGLVRYGWQTYAWSGGRWEPRAQLRQYSNGHAIDGVGVDYDHSTDPDFGQW